MKTPVEIKQVLQRELEGWRSGSLRRPVTSKEKVARPAGSEYSDYSPLDRARLRKGYTLCVANAARLIADARVLRDVGRYRSAYLILSLTLEELGAALQLYDARRSGVEDWDAWWRRYESHPRELQSGAVHLPRTTDERSTPVRSALMYVEFGKNLHEFMPPRGDDDKELVELLETDTAYAEALLGALPPHAFERWEFQEMVKQSPEMEPSILYARVGELVSQEPTVSERDLLFAIARDLGKSPDDFAAGFERWKEVAPKARAYLDLLRQDSLKKERETEGA
jgi:hypothetical protein